MGEPLSKPTPTPAFTEATGSPAVDSAIGLGWLRQAQRHGHSWHCKWTPAAVADFVSNCKIGTFDEAAVVVLTEEVLRLRLEVARLELGRPLTRRKRDNKKAQ